MNNIFDWCVTLLEWLAEKLNMSYQQINVIIFVIIWPMLTIALILGLIICHFS
jgi:hypothetical protein